MAEDVTSCSFPTGKQHVSFSEYKDWTECSYRHWLTQVQKVGKNDVSPALVFGTSVHYYCELFLSNPSNQVENIEKGLEKLGVEWEAGYAIDPKSFSKDKFADYLQDLVQIATGLPAWFNTTFPDWKVVAVEKQLFVPIENENGYKFKGFVDAAIISDNKLWLLDWKTSSKGWDSKKKTDAITHKQLQLYAQFWPQQDLPMSAAFVVLRRSGRDSTRYELVSAPIDVENRQSAKKSLVQMTTMVERGIKMKNRSSCFFCQYKRTSHCT